MTPRDTRSARIILPLVLAIIAGAASFSTFRVVHANSTSHWTSGTTGTHTMPSHNLNPAHIWLSIGADHSSPITSGGRWHDSCICAPLGGDYAMDIGNPGANDVAAKLYVNYAGAGANPNPAIDNTKSITISAKVVQQDTSIASCQWQKIDIRVSYWGIGGTFYSNLVVGELWEMHLDTWMYGVGATIFANASMTNPYGSGSVSYINGLKVGQ